MFRHTIDSFAGARVAKGAMLAVVTAALFLSMTGCATYSAKLVDLRPRMVNGEYDLALQTVEKETGGKDRLLYHLERGTLLHFADRWVESNEAFADAELLADDLYTKSLSEGALSLITNDMANSYRARPFEMAMVPYYKALNYIYLGQRDEAQVEARRSTEMLAKYVDATVEGIRDEDKSLLEMTRNNAFMLYFSGMLFDWDGELNDAFIAYRNAASAFQANYQMLDLEIPPALAGDLQRVAERLSFSTELDQIRQDCPAVFGAFEAEAEAKAETEARDLPFKPEDYMASVGWTAGQGELVVCLEDGFVPQKTQTRIDIPIFEGETYDDPDYWSWELYNGMGEMKALSHGRKVEYWASVALPELYEQPPSFAWVRISAYHQLENIPPNMRIQRGEPDSRVFTSQVENLNASAMITFEAEKPTIIFRTILRGLTKYLATRGVRKKTGTWGGLAANLLGSVTETADTRSWLTLPRGVHLARLNLPPGSYDLKLELLDFHGLVLGSRTISGIQVQAGEWTFVSQRIF